MNEEAYDDFEQYVESLNETEAQEFIAALTYEVGLTGVGPTALDQEPACLLSEELKQRFMLIIDNEKDYRKNVFRASQILVMGEIDGQYATEEQVAEAKKLLGKDDLDEDI